MQDVSHPIHRVRIYHSKFSSPKTCSNIDKSSFKIGRTSDPSPSQTLKRANDDSGSLIRMHAWSSRNCMTSQTCKRRKRAHFSRVFFGEILLKFVYFMIQMLTSQYNFVTKFYLRISFFNQKYENVRFLRIPQINFSFFQIKVLSEIVFTRLPSFKIFYRG